MACKRDEGKCCDDQKQVNMHAAQGHRGRWDRVVKERMSRWVGNNGRYEIT